MQLFDALNNKTWKDEYKIHAWSDEKGREILMATVALDQDSNLTIIPSDAGAASYARMGLHESPPGVYVLGMHDAPTSLVATALGLPGNTHAFVRGVTSDLGRTPSAFDMLDVALRGHPAQSGRINAADVEDSILKIPEDQFVDLNADQTGSLTDLYVRYQEDYQGMTKSSVLARVGSQIVPAYLVTVEEGLHANANDRLAIYAAALKEVGQVDRVLADKPLKFIKTSDGKTALLCQDATKPSFNALNVVPSARNPSVSQVCIPRSQLEAKRSLENGATLMRGKDPVAVRAYVQVNAIQDLVQDSIGISVNQPRRTPEGLVRADRLEIPQHVTVETLGAMISANTSLVADKANRLGQATHSGTDLGDNTVQRLRSFARKASSYLAEVERLPEARAPEEPAKQARVYSLMDLS